MVPHLVPTVTGQVPFVHRLAANGDAVALVCGGGRTTYGELAERVQARAAVLGSGRRLVLLVAEPSTECVVTYLAALHAGHVVLPASDERPGALQALRDRYRPDVVVEKGRAGAPQVLDDAPRHDLHPDLALLLSTSGTTGSPKLVRLSHENLQSNAEAVAGSLGLTRDDVGVTTLPLSYCYGLSVLHSHLAVGASVLLTPLSVVDPCFWTAVRGAGVTSLPGVPYTFDLLDRLGPDVLDLGSLRLVTQAGGRLAPERVLAWAERGRRHGFDLVVMYGQTEATARMACLPPHLAARRPTSVGVAVPGGRLRIEPVPGRDDGAGELVYEGPNVMLGYARTPDDLALGRTTTSLRTGDLATIDADGMVEIVGRTARIAKVFGVRIDLAHAEDLLARYGHRTCVVEVDGGLVVAAEGEPDDRWLARLAAEDLGLPRHVVTVVAVDALPRTTSGKVDTESVRRLVPSRAEPVHAAPAAGTAGTDVRALFAEVLDRPDARPSDTFVGLGGDSLSYVAVSVRLEQVLGHLPQAWHVTPIGGLRPRRRRVRWVRQVETGVLVRAVAVVLIVATHVGVLAAPGSAHVLLALAGYNVARFQLDARPRGDRARALARGAFRVALPSVLWVAVAGLLFTDSYGPQNLLLLNSVLGPATWDASWHFWFVEVLLWILVGLALLAGVPAVDRVERRAPFAVALVVLGAGLTARFELLPFDLLHPRPVLWVFALGWAAARAEQWWQRAVVTAVALASVPGFFGEPQRDAVILVGVLLVLWVPTLPLPTPLASPVATLAGASLFVYLTHWQVYGRVESLDPWLAVAVSLLVGVAYGAVAGRLTRAVERAGSRLRLGAGGPLPPGGVADRRPAPGPGPARRPARRASPLCVPGPGTPAAPR